MKKILLAVSAIALLTGMSTSCQKEIETTQDNNRNTGFTLTADIADNGSKVSFSDDGNLHPTWQVGDVIIGFDDAATTGTYGFEATKVDASSGVATFELLTEGDYAGSVKGSPANGTTLYLVYAPGVKPDSIDVKNKALTVNIAVQSKDVVPALMMASGAVKDKTLKLTFENKTAVIGIKQPTMAAANTDYTCIALLGSNIRTEVKFDLSGKDGALKASYQTPGVISKGVNFKSGADKTTSEVTYIVVCPTDGAANYTFVSNYLETSRKKGKELVAGNYYYMHPIFTGGHAEGLLPGLFTVDKQTVAGFSKGNLQATCTKAGPQGTSEYSWGFAENQYDTLGRTSGNMTIADQTSGAKVDLFGWVAESGMLNGDATKYGIAVSTKDTYMTDYGNVLGENLKADWGTTIDNDGTWQSLTMDEVAYLLSFDNPKKEGKPDKSNPTRKGMHADSVTVVGHKNCIVIYPDGFAGTKVSNRDETAYDTPEKWAAAEAAGVVCLPAAGTRGLSTVRDDVGKKPFYWTKQSPDGGNNKLDAYGFGVYFECYNATKRMIGGSVRLVSVVTADARSTETPSEDTPGWDWE